MHLGSARVACAHSDYCDRERAADRGAVGADEGSSDALGEHCVCGKNARGDGSRDTRVVEDGREDASIDTEGRGRIDGR